MGVFDENDGRFTLLPPFPGETIGQNCWRRRKQVI
jgi:hypothetical protein